MTSFRESFPLDKAPTEADAYRVCEWFQVGDVTGATQRAVAALLLPGPYGIASDLRQARDAITNRLQVLAEQAELVAPDPWTEAHEQHLDIAARQADETQLPDGLTWCAAPTWANGLVASGADEFDKRQMVWVPAVAGDVFGMNAVDFRHMKRGSGQNCSLSDAHSAWTILAIRPPGAAVDQSGR